MTDRHDPTWDPEDDEFVRAALMSLMDDVRSEPLPEPAFVRARAEGRDGERLTGGTVVPLSSRRRRVLGAIAGVAAAAVVATSVALVVRDQQGPGTAPAGTTTVTSQEPIRMLGSRDWSGALGLDVTSTEGSTDPQGQCFETPATGGWDRSTATLAAGTVVAGQWIGTADGAAAPTEAVDEAVTRCEGTYHVTQTITRPKSEDVRYRFWHLSDDAGATYWWIEATRGSSLTYMSVAEVEGMTYDVDDMERVADTALGRAEVATDSPATSTP